jgi:hypothetical protein
VQSGCLLIGEGCRELPAGSTLDGDVFYWLIGAPFFTEYEVHFSGRDDWQYGGE